MALTSWDSGVRAAPIPKDFMSVGEIRRSIQIAIRDSVRENTQPPFFLITKVELTLRGEVEGGASGGFRIPVFGAEVDLGASLENFGYAELALSLVPSQSVVTGVVPKLDLASIVSAVKQAFSDEIRGDNTEQDEDASLPLLTTPGFRYTYQWALKEKVDGSINLLVVNFGADIAHEHRQTIVFHLCRTENKLNCVPDI